MKREMEGGREREILGLIYNITIPATFRCRGP